LSPDGADGLPDFCLDYLWLNFVSVLHFLNRSKELLAALLLCFELPQGDHGGHGFAGALNDKLIPW
jgi:hypothetical protein